ncbi:MAG: PEGA domain-containing protein [Acidobacteria bacterium]|nr:PEGA domain-containing protein [Acidobacteriota bacterium]
MNDGLGPRTASTDAATGEPVELLELSAELALHTPFATALTERVTRLSAVRHASYVHLRRVDRPNMDRLVVVSDATPGHRLSDVLDAAAGERPPIEAVVALLRQLLPAVSLFSRHNRAHALGTIAPERIFISSPARVVIADSAFGAALDLLQLSPVDAWQRYRVAAPSSIDPVTSTTRADATAVGVVALSVLLGRRLTTNEYPAALPALIADARERHGDEDHPLSSVFARWLRRALQLEGGGFDSPQAAQIAFEEVLASNRRYVTGTDALEQWVEKVAGPLTPPAPEPEPSLAAPAPEPVETVVDTPEAAPTVEATPAVPTGRIFGIPRWALVLLAVLIVQAGVIGWYWTRPAPGPVEGEGELVVTSRPVGATVIVNGTARGETPLTLTLAAGAHVVEVRAGTSEPRVIPLMIRANMQTAQYVELQEAAPTPPPVERKAPVRRRR